MTGEGPFRPCRCLIAEMPDEKALARVIRERTAQIPEAERCPPDLYRQRLDVCRACGKLNRGTCALCGCYVEIRAARGRMRCPDMPPGWTEVFLSDE